MKFSKRVNYLLILFLAMLNVALRYPKVQHELGADSFVIHILSNSITQYHYGKWILHPLSYIGLYPLSYPSAYPYLAAGVSLSSGIDVESSILTISIAIGLIGVFSTYFLAREIKNDDLFCFVAALTFSLSPIFIRTTFWSASTRNLFISLAPACILLLVKTRGFSNNRMNFLFVIVLVTVGTSHRLGVFMIIILIAYLTAVLIYALYKQLIPIATRSRKLQRSFRFVGPLIITLIFLFLLGNLLYGDNPLQGAGGLDVYEETVILSGDALHILIINLFISLTGRIGFMIVFALIGLLYLIWKKNKGLYEVFMIVSLIFIFPTLGMRTYSSYFFLIFFSLFAGLIFIYFFRVLKKRWKIVGLAVLIGALFASVGFYNFMFEHWDVKSGSMSESEYDSAIYMKYMTNNSFIADEGLVAARVGAISKKSCLPIGGSTLRWVGPEQLIYDYLEEDDFQIIAIPLQTISVGSDALYEAKGAGNVESDWMKIHRSPCNEIEPNLVSKYRVQYSLAAKADRNQVLAYGTQYLSRLLKSAELERYKIYDNGIFELHYIEYA